VNVCQEVCTVSPVFPMKDLNRIVCGILGWNIDTKRIEAELEKVRKTLNVSRISGSLFDPDSYSEEQLRQMEILQRDNERHNKGLAEEVRNLGLQIKADLANIQGKNPDEISLLNQISGACYQSIPEYSTMYVPHLKQLINTAIRPTQRSQANDSYARS